MLMNMACLGAAMQHGAWCMEYWHGHYGHHALLMCMVAATTPAAGYPVFELTVCV